MIKNKTEVQGHRGNRSVYPENTLPSFSSAIEIGADGIELDLHVTKDREIVIYHDFFLAEDSSSPLISSLNLSDIKKIDCGNKVHPRFPKQQKIPGTQIPTLDELFALIRKSKHPNAKNIRLNLEIKRSLTHPQWSLGVEELSEKIVSKVKEWDFAPRVYYSSFDPEVLSKIHSLDPQAPLAFLFGKESIPQLQMQGPLLAVVNKIATSCHAKTLSPEYSLLTKLNFEWIQQEGFQVVVWTVNDPQEWTRCIEIGVDGIITDYPEELLRFLHR